MHIAVDVAKSKEGDTFATYITALEKAGYVTPPMKPWVDLIRTRANEGGDGPAELAACLELGQDLLQNDLGEAYSLPNDVDAQTST